MQRPLHWWVLAVVQDRYNRLEYNAELDEHLGDEEDLHIENLHPQKFFRVPQNSFAGMSFH